MEKLLKNVNLVVASVLLVIVVVVFEVAVSLTTSCGSCADAKVGFAIAAVFFRILAYVCVLFSALLAVLILLDLITSLISVRLTCAVVNIMMTIIAVVLVKGDMFFFLLHG